MVKTYSKSLLWLAANATFLRFLPLCTSMYMRVRFSKSSVFASPQRDYKQVLRGIILGFIAGLAAMPALACGVMAKADPKVGSSVSAPEKVSVIFTQAIVPASSGVVITDEAWQGVKVGPMSSSQSDTVLTVPLPLLKAGTYKVHWHVLWADCNSKTEGDYHFNVVKP